jgi:methanogenic corrinoid protein MtbC1
MAPRPAPWEARRGVELQGGGMLDAQRTLEEALLRTDRVAASRVLQAAAAEEDALAAVEQLIAPVLERIGAGWERGENALAQVYMAGVICEELVDALLPPRDHRRKDSPRVALAVLDDFHLLGKRLVYSVLRAAGYEVLDLGRVTPEELLARVREGGIDVVLPSVLMLPSALRVREVADGLPPGVRLGVGGAPFRLDPKLGHEVGAHAVGATASDALAILRAFAREAA